MEQNRFKDYSDRERRLVLDFEHMLTHQKPRFFDLDDLTSIIDFYIDTCDIEMVDKAVRQAERLFPDSPDIRLRRAMAMYLHHRYKPALVLLQSLHDADPEDRDVLYAMGLVYSALGKSDEAIWCYKQSASDGYHVEVQLCNIGDEYMKKGDLKQAEEYYLQAMEYEDVEDRAFINLNTIWTDADRCEYAIQYWNEFLAQHPYSDLAWFCLSKVYLIELLFEKAEEALQYALTINPEFLDAYPMLAQTQQLLGRNNDAIATLRDLLQYTDDPSAVQLSIGCNYFDLGNFDTAAIYLKESVESNPYNTTAWGMLGLVYAHMGETSLANKACKKALSLDMISEDDLFHVASAFKILGDVDNAIKILKLIAVHPDADSSAWQFLIDLYIEEEEYDQALDVISSCIYSTEEDASLHLRAAYCYYMTKNRSAFRSSLLACAKSDYGAMRHLETMIPEILTDPDYVNVLQSFNPEER